MIIYHTNGGSGVDVYILDTVCEFSKEKVCKKMMSLN